MKYLDDSGLSHLISKIKSLVNSKVSDVKEDGSSIVDENHVAQLHITTSAAVQALFDLPIEDVNLSIDIDANGDLVAAWSHGGTNYQKNLSDIFSKAEVNNLLGGKVDKETGKGLSTNDFTNTYKSALDNLETNLNLKADKSNTYTKAEVDALTTICSSAAIQALFA